MQKEIIINGSTSDWYQQATFLLKEEHTKKPPEDLMAFADTLIEDYMKKQDRSQLSAYSPSPATPKKPSNSFSSDTLITIFTVASISFLCIILLLCFMR